jgi:hypothetical protein
MASRSATWDGLVLLEPRLNLDEKSSLDSCSIDLVSLIDFADDYPQNTVMKKMISLKSVPAGTTFIKPVLIFSRFDD